MNNLIIFHLFSCQLIEIYGKKGELARKTNRKQWISVWLIGTLTTVLFFLLTATIIYLCVFCIRRQPKASINLVQRRSKKHKISPSPYQNDDFTTIQTVGRASDFTNDQGEQNELKTII